jgi:hypothetical protein
MMPSRLPVFVATMVLACAVCLVPSESAAFKARLAWEPTAGASGYRLYIRTAGSDYGAPVELPGLTPDTDGIIRYVATGLTASTSHYFEVTGYADGVESSPSNEVVLPYAKIAGFLDTDGDGLLDIVEDLDLDMVLDPGETDRLRADTDGDGISDGAERQRATDPLDPNDPAPGTDACATATTVPALGGTFTGTTTGASSLAGTCADTTAAPEKVFRWTPLTSGVATIDSCSDTGTAFDSVVYVRSADCKIGPQIACNDDTGSCMTSEPNDHHGSRVQPTVTAGETYFIVVDGFKSAGAFVLHIVPPAVVVPIPTITAQPVKTATATPRPSATVTATPRPTTTATATPRPTTTVTPQPTTTVTATRTALPTSTATRTATPVPTQTATLTATAVPTATATATAKSTSTATPTPEVKPTSTPDLGGICGAATTLPAEGGKFTGRTYGSRVGQLAGSCGATRTASERVFSWTPAFSGSALIHTCDRSDTTFDTVLYVRRDVCAGGTEVACVNDSRGCSTTNGRSKGSAVRLEVAAGQTYYVVVDGAYGATGRFSLTIEAPDATGTIAGSDDPPALETPDASPEPEATPDASVAIAYRCQRAASLETTPYDPAPPTLRIDDRFAESTASVQDSRMLCTPVDTVDGDPAAGHAPLQRYDVRLEDYTLKQPSTFHARNVLGEIDVDVTRLDEIQVPVNVDPPLTASAPDVTESTEAAPMACYRVRNQNDDGERRWTLTIGDDDESYDVSGPVLVCVTDPRDSDPNPGTVQLCYRARVIPASADTATDEQTEDDPRTDAVTVASRFDAATRDLGALNEICLPSELTAVVP